MIFVKKTPSSWGILGLGRHARRTMIPAFKQAQGVSLKAVASISATSVGQSASPLRLPEECRLLGSYAELIADDSIDFVYLALPNHLHAHWSKEALRAGKHVLCEKPAALNLSEITDVLTDAQTHQRVFREALMYRFHAQHQQVKHLMGLGRIGEVRLLEAHFHYYHDSQEDIRLNPKAGGGALLDVGCYLVDCARFLFAEEPLWVSAVAYLGPETEVDESVSLQLAFQGSKAAQLTCGCRFGRENSYTLYGTHGRIHLKDAFLIPRNKQPLIEIEDLSGKKELLRLPAMNPYVRQIEAFSRLCQGEKTQEEDVEESLFSSGLENMRILDAAREAFLSGQTVKIQ
jgi:predicted dehydrogenase